MKNSPKNALILTLCILAIAVSVVSASSFKRTHVGQQVDDFTLEALDGSSHSLKGSMGQKATIVVFWAAWSPRSAEILTDMQTLYGEHGPDGLGVFGVNVEHAEWDPTEVDKITRVASDSGVAFPMVVDKDLEIFNYFGVVAVPSALLLDKDSKAIQLLTGYSTTGRNSFKEDVLRALGLLKEDVDAAKDAPVVYKPKGKSMRYYNMAVRLFEKKRYSRALSSLESAFKADPDYADAHRLLARIHEKKGEDDKAALSHAKADELQNAFNKEHGLAAVVATEPVKRGAPKTAAEKLADMMAKKAARAKEPTIKVDEEKIMPSMATAAEKADKPEASVAEAEKTVAPAVVESAAKVEEAVDGATAVVPKAATQVQQTTTAITQVVVGETPAKVEVKKKRVRVGGAKKRVRVRPKTN